MKSYTITVSTNDYISMSTVTGMRELREELRKHGFKKKTIEIICKNVEESGNLVASKADNKAIEIKQIGE